MKIFDCQKVNNIPHKNKLELEKIQQFSTQISLLANIPIIPKESKYKGVISDVY